MDNCFENNWVERRYAREQRLSDTGRVWLDVCAAILSAVRSFNKHYRAGKPEVEIAPTEDNGHLRIVAPDESGTQSVQIDVNQNGRSIRAQYSSGISNRNFLVDANHESTYLKCGDDRCDADDVSQLVLERVLFPRSGTGGWRPERII